MLESENIICIAPNQWDGIWRRRQQLMSRFTRGNRILYVEPARFVLFALLSRERLARLLDRKFYLRQEDTSLFILSQYLILPFESTFLRIGFSRIKRLNDWFNIRMLKRTLNKLNFSKPILWVYFTPRSEPFIGKCRERLVVCDVYDRYSAYPYYDNEPWLKQYTYELEVRLIAKANVVFACSAPLFRYCQSINPVVHLVANGTDTPLLDIESAVPEDTREIKPPILGYVGAIFEKLDFELLNYLGSGHEGWSILMIGPTTSPLSQEDKKNVSLLKEKSNVYFLGSKPRAELPGYYSVIDVALMPYKLTEHTESISPLKMFEYMAFRRPVASTDIPAVREFSDVISIAYDREQFADCVAKLLSDDNRGRVQQGFEIARQNSWDRRVEEISRILNARLYNEER